MTRAPSGRERSAALGVAAATNLICAGVFWVIVLLVGSPTFFSFWHRSLAGRIALTLLFVAFGARLLVWYARKLHVYARVRGRGALRLTPLAFGLGIFAITISWLGVTLVGESLYRAIRLFVAPEGLDLTVLIMPLVFFIQFLFSQSTLIWLLLGGLAWQTAVRLPTTRTWLLAYYPRDEKSLHSTSLAFVKSWNTLGYMILILSLLFQS